MGDWKSAAPGLEDTVFPESQAIPSPTWQQSKSAIFLFQFPFLSPPFTVSFSSKKYNLK
ncbi:hypothetical protein OBV_07620 [Oscillibacter valericigenes Sjm18-20]|nr:hypothetical protein OBV_07620 [Oscillibacter valericigenes Sjm18-20]